MRYVVSFIVGWVTYVLVSMVGMFVATTFEPPSDSPDADSLAVVLYVLPGIISISLALIATMLTLRLFDRRDR